MPSDNKGKHERARQGYGIALRAQGSGLGAPGRRLKGPVTPLGDAALCRAMNSGYKLRLVVAGCDLLSTQKHTADRRDHMGDH